MNRKVMIVIFSVIIVVLVVMLIWGISWRDGWNRMPGIGWNTAGLEAGTTFEFAAGEVNELRVDLVAENVQIEPTDGTQILVEQTAAQALSERDRIRCGLRGRTLVVESGRRGTFSFWAEPAASSTVRILVPKAAVLKAGVDTVSGRTWVRDLQWHDFDADSASGDISLENVVARSASLEAISGSVRVKDCEFDEMRCEATSGSVEAEAQVRGDARVSTVSGSQNFRGSGGSFKAETASGDAQIEIQGADTVAAESISGSVRITCQEASGLREVDCETASGDVTLELPAGVAVNVDFDSASGDLNLNDMDGQMSASGVRVDVETISGDLTIRSLKAGVAA